MYNTSQAYKAELASHKVHDANVRIHLTTQYWDSTQRQWVADNYTLSNNNIVEGSVNISAQMTSDGDMSLGGVYAKQLDISLCNLPSGLGYNMLKNARLNVDVGMTVEGVIEYVPMGIYIISSVEYTNEGIECTAFDYMQMFDKPVDTDAIKTQEALDTKPYDWAYMAAMACNVSLGNTRTEFAAFLGGHGDTVNMHFNIDDYGDVVTWRDFIFRLGQAVGCFCLIDRDNLLQFIPYGGTPVSAQSSIALDGQSAEVNSVRLSDNTIKFGGFRLTNADGTEQYYGRNVAEIDKQMAIFYELIDAAELAIDTAVDTIQALQTEKSAIEEAYAAGKITQSEYETQMSAIEAQITANNQAISDAEDSIDFYEQELDDWDDHKDAYYDDAVTFEVGYNPFLVSNYNIRWWLLDVATPFAYTPFVWTGIGNAGYDIGDYGYITVGGHIGNIYVMSWVYDLYTLTLEGFGADSATQSAKTQATNTASAGISQLNKQVNALTETVNSVSGKVSDGKAIIASAITDKGIYTEASVSYKEMAVNIRAIQGEGGENFVDKIDIFTEGNEGLALIDTISITEVS